MLMTFWGRWRTQTCHQHFVSPTFRQPANRSEQLNEFIWEIKFAKPNHGVNLSSKNTEFGWTNSKNSFKEKFLSYKKSTNCINGHFHLSWNWYELPRVKWDETNTGDRLIITVDHVQMTLILCKFADLDRTFERLKQWVLPTGCFCVNLI